ncbi:MAG: patatin-like phospholipase family protein [Candidatus Accumulibacter sp.]|uniref:patatin-like phospholipase family protein n=1 Tax=Accumulibacter sp. TaxID=2053492 RepID=UPI002879C13F|nr:patatin-like phospholipase family protein [Accumulibacter sp.]MDS4015920.1 patatin-like phospholipase family protein [Accumulibacter sp.]
MNQNLISRIDAGGSKKILACDGGGILGLISVEILARLERELRSALGQPKLVLADYFDFVCGTSTGAIIAACISAGMPMERIRSFYVDSGEQMFDKASLLHRLQYSYNDEPLAAKLREELDQALAHVARPGEPNATLGDAGLRTLLMMVMRNATTDSPWPVSNNPRGKYNQLARKDCNLRLPLWQLVRASTAAPTFFPPEVVTFARGTPDEYQFIFVDGGVTTYNNPAFLAFQMATAAPYKICWPTGSDRLLIVSVGTGNAAKARPDLEASDLWLLDNARNLPGALMNAALAGWDMACRTLGECRFGAPIDREFGDMVIPAGGASNASASKQFAYVRYDPDVSQSGLGALGLAEIKAENVQVLDSVKYIPDIQRVGRTYAEHCVRIEHLRGFA